MTEFYMIIARKIFDPPNPRGTWGNFGETRGGVGKKWHAAEQKRQYL